MTAVVMPRTSAIRRALSPRSGAVWEHCTSIGKEAISDQPSAVSGVRLQMKNIPRGTTAGQRGLAEVTACKRGTAALEVGSAGARFRDRCFSPPPTPLTGSLPPPLLAVTAFVAAHAVVVAAEFGPVAAPRTR